MQVLVDTCVEECDEIYVEITSKIPLKELMQIVRKYRDRDLFLRINRKKKMLESITFYEGNDEECIFVPIPKRFAVLEPDEHYFEVTLKANIVLALKGEKDYHR
ncbi:conserved hypothetical protein [Ferroglobus placidus DSM 10642]|uniref:Uncharacterized protein n=1 Tax=Ferroglobus placidus (strain DSM 10642 / AEDII12DO) TaxID=589924 RepID=D3S0X2_FERPA|nr:hypothetical protein [Ferroglobus placidus]ADC66363.1 conserved hypothetical protein [Ferroglobus placidus DSM 10642]